MNNQLTSTEYVGGKRKVLVIEDNQLNREILCEILSEQYQTVQAENGKEGFEVLREHYQEISLILLDIEMPVMNGYRFLEEIRCHALFHQIPVVVATGNNSLEEEESCLALGAIDFISKPYNPNIVISRVSNLIRLRESAAALSHLEYDGLTGLYTKEAMFHRMERVLKRNPELSYSVIICEITHLQQIRKTYGEPCANQVLINCARVLKKQNIRGNLIGRFGENQFAAMVPMVSDIVYTKVLMDAIRNVELPPGVKSSIKFGIYDDIDHMYHPCVLCDRALMALATIRNQYGRVSAIYEDHLERVKQKQVIIEQTMQEALERDEFKVYYQPKHDVKTGKLIGAEALIRWCHPEFGFMMPGEFIPLFEKNGFIAEVDFYVWKRTCQNIRRWMDRRKRTIPMSVNTSRLDFAKCHFLDSLIDETQYYRIPPKVLHIEVTESLFSEHLNETAKVLEKYQNYGFKIELDDFGTGYSSLHSLGVLPLDYVKLDMSFIQELEDDRRMRLLMGCVDLTKALNLPTICEGVETEEQMRILKNLGVDIAQGYYFSKPIPEEEFEEYLDKYA